ncbi:MAG: hypothetical protein DRP64_14990 [Verrucomicrobia bacterium]|nr:MAG: hypothetical protein DRP64_14990 [Verrucomicrobiota bacterium]
MTVSANMIYDNTNLWIRGGSSNTVGWTWGADGESAYCTDLFTESSPDAPTRIDTHLGMAATDKRYTLTDAELTLAGSVTNDIHFGFRYTVGGVPQMGPSTVIPNGTSGPVSLDLSGLELLAADTQTPWDSQSTFFEFWEPNGSNVDWIAVDSLVINARVRDEPEAFSVSATSVYAGESVKLRWDVLGAEWIFIDLGAENIVTTNSAVGSVDVVQPLGTNTYVLIATNSSGSVTQEVVVVAVEFVGAPAGTLFNDTFDTTDTTDLNTSLSSRQAAGLLTSTYTEQIDANSSIAGNKLGRTATGIVTLDTNFASYLGSQPFTLSFDFFAVTAVNKWTAIHVKNALDVARSASPMQVYFRGDNSVNNLIFLQYGTGGAVDSLLISSNTVATALGSAFSIHDEHNYAFEVSPTDRASGTYDFLVDGVAVAENLPYAFSENIERIIVFTGLNLDARFDNLDITVLGEEIPPVLSISVDHTSSLSFEWGSILDKQYDLESITSLLLTNWTAYNDGVTLYTNIQASGTGTNSLTGVLAPASNAFFRVNEM